jgi:hypothetical protein
VILTAQFDKEVGLTNMTATVKVGLKSFTPWKPVPFSGPTMERQKKAATRKLLQNPLSSFILSQPIPTGWTVQHDKGSHTNEYGIYFLHTESSKATAILWQDPNNVIGEDTELTQDVVKRLQPLEYHFPEAFHVKRRNPLMGALSILRLTSDSEETSSEESDL